MALRRMRKEVRDFKAEREEGKRVCGKKEVKCNEERE